MGEFSEHRLFSPHAPINPKRNMLAVAVTARVLRFRYISVTPSFGRGPPSEIRSQSI